MPETSRGAEEMKSEKEIENYLEVLKEMDYYEAEKWMRVLRFVLDKPQKLQSSPTKKEKLR